MRQWSITELGGRIAVELLVMVMVTVEVAPHEEAQDGEEEPRHVVHRVEGHRGAGQESHDHHQEHDGHDPPMTRRRRRGLARQVRQIVEEAMQVSARRRRHGGVESGLELCLVEPPFGVVAREFVRHGISFIV